MSLAGTDDTLGFTMNTNYYLIIRHYKDIHNVFDYSSNLLFVCIVEISRTKMNYVTISQQLVSVSIL